MKLYLDPGHGGKDPGGVGNGIEEKDINLDIALRIRSILLSNYKDVEVRMSRTDDRTKSLTERTNEANAWDADYYLSIHCNALDGSANGYEDFIYTTLSNSSITARYQDIMHEEIMRTNGLKDRGQKKANFHVLRESTMPALLTENGFVDNKGDAALIKQASWREKVAKGHVKGLAKAFNLQLKPAKDTPLYKVIAGSFKSKDNADDRITFLKSKGIPAFMATALINGTQFYRVQAGAFSTEENAEQQLEQVKKAGINDAYLAKPQAEVEVPEVGGVPILGRTLLSPEQMNQFAKSVNPKATEIALYYLLYGEYYGIRGDIAFAQAMLETDYLRFTGVVKPDQNNFSGIGATSSDNPGATFENPEQGVLAQIQHLYAYAFSNPLPNQYPIKDPRFHLVTRSSATTWEALNGKWAVPGDNYGQLILNIYEKMIEFSVNNLRETLQDVKKNRK